MTELLTPGSTGPNGETGVSQPPADSTNRPNDALELDSAMTAGSGTGLRVASPTTSSRDTGQQNGALEPDFAGSREGMFPRVDLWEEGFRVLEGALLEDVADTTSMPALIPRPAPPLSENPYLVYLASLRGDEARRAMAGCLDRIAALFAARAGFPIGEPAGLGFPWAELRYQHTAAIRALLAEQTGPDGQAWAPSYRNKHLTALRMVLKQAWLLGHMTAEDYQRAAEIKPFHGSRLPPGRSVAPAERRAMIEASLADDNELLGLRDAALIAGLYATGARREEAACARRHLYDPGGRALRIIGKGDKEREVYVTEYAAKRIGEWLVAAGPGEFLFRPVDRWGNLGPHGMTGDAINKRIHYRARQTGTPPLSAHDLRRSFISDLLDAGVDLATAQRLAGHASAATTAKYDRRKARARQAAVDNLDRWADAPAG